MQQCATVVRGDHNANCWRRWVSGGFGHAYSLTMFSGSGVCFIAWTSRDGRASDIAAALGGAAYTIFPKALSAKPLTPLRYAVSAVLTVFHLCRTRPAAVIVTSPPIFAPLVVALCSSALGLPYVLDSHPTAFGAKDHKMSRRFLPIQRLVSRRAALSLVTTEHWVKTVENWGGRAMVFHEAPPPWFEQMGGPPPRSERENVLFAGIFGGDEPVDAVIGAAALIPSVDVLLTGDPARCRGDLRRSTPRNVRFTGYLIGPAYAEAIAAAGAVLALTTEPTSVMRAAYEAVYARRPLVISDTPVLRNLFPNAVFVANDARSIADGVSQALDRRVELLAAADEALTLQLRRWSEQLAALQTHLATAAVVSRP